MMSKKLILFAFFLCAAMIATITILDTNTPPPTVLRTSEFKSWEDGVVTVLKPVIARNCSKLLAGDKEEIRRVQARKKEWENSLTDGELLQKTKSCRWVKYYFTNNLYTTQLERSFPIAYTITVHNSPQQVVRLLKFLYRPTNTYCIHPDARSSYVFVNIFRNLGKCLENVVIPTKLIRVKWARDHSILDAQMACLSKLVELRSHQTEQAKWKYVVNLCGKEVPLVTTHAIASHLSKRNGVSYLVPKKVDSSVLGKVRYTEAMRRLRNRKVPFNLTYYKSMTYMGLSYTFANYLLMNNTAIKVREFFEQCAHSEEHFYATLFKVPGVPGGFSPTVSYYQISNTFWAHNRGPCTNREVHQICIVGAADLQSVRESKAHAFFHTKYFMELDHTIMDCVEERLVAENMREYEQDFDSSRAMASTAHGYS